MTEIEPNIRKVMSGCLFDCQPFTNIRSIIHIRWFVVSVSREHPVPYIRYVDAQLNMKRVIVLTAESPEMRIMNWGSSSFIRKIDKWWIPLHYTETHNFASHPIRSQTINESIYHFNKFSAKPEQRTARHTAAAILTHLAEATFRIGIKEIETVYANLTKAQAKKVPIVRASRPKHRNSTQTPCSCHNNYLWPPIRCYAPHKLGDWLITTLLFYPKSDSTQCASRGPKSRIALYSVILSLFRSKLLQCFFYIHNFHTNSVGCCWCVCATMKTICSDFSTRTAQTLIAASAGDRKYVDEYEYLRCFRKIPGLRDRWNNSRQVQKKKMIIIVVYLVCLCVWQTKMKRILQSCGLHAIFCHCKIFHFFLSRAKENKKFQSTKNWNSQKCLCRVESTREKKTQSLFTDILLFHATSIKK